MLHRILVGFLILGMLGALAALAYFVGWPWVKEVGIVMALIESSVWIIYLVGGASLLVFILAALWAIGGLFVRS